MAFGMSSTPIRQCLLLLIGLHFALHWKWIVYACKRCLVPALEKPGSGAVIDACRQKSLTMSPARGIERIGGHYESHGHFLSDFVGRLDAGGRPLPAR